MRIEPAYYYYPPLIYKDFDAQPISSKFQIFCNPLATPPPLVEVDTVSEPITREGVTHFSSGAALIQGILESGPQVLAFSEIHPRNPSQSPMPFFAEEILPSIAASGKNALIIEHLFCDDAIERDLARFYETGEITAEDTPDLFYNVNLYSYHEELVELLCRARELRIRIIPGGLSRQTAEETILKPDFEERPDLELRARAEIMRNTLAQVRRILESNQTAEEPERVIVYSGRRHNDINPPGVSLNPDMNYGAVLAERLGEAYYEIDLMSPYLIRLPMLSEDIPASGVNIIKNGNSYTVLFPRDN